ncbi:MAG TPA: asparagine synthase (glutamine-hydrolyzing) [Gaiellaceae bacterium]|nr:asparagine synthase (glutamine-hydrolyzing) [Gaiellaceae bacterium]
MCGICGWIDSESAVDPAVLKAMTWTLRHRGPDDEGFLFESTGRASVGLGFRRLSIIDLVTGNQPISNEDGTVQVVFNGEIYNFRELRRELESRGHEFRTGSDTEVLVHLYEEDGPELATRLNGMFAFAIWDARRSTLTLGRDRFGKKPLYYAELSHGLIFGSEIKALLAHPASERSLDRDALGEYLALEYVPAPRSIFAGIRKVPRAHVLTWNDGASTIRQYWDLPYAPDENPASVTEYAEELKRLIWSAVSRRLLSDVPLGAFLSGGIDSSTVVAAMSELLPAGSVKTFSIGFAESSFDESAQARLVARHFATDHHEQTFTPDALLSLLPTIADAMDEPFADPSVLPTYLLSRFTREHVTVALGGDGGDELLAGYPTFFADRVAGLLPRPAALGRRLGPMVRKLPVSTANISLDFKVKRFVRGLAHPPAERHAAWLGAFTPAEQQPVLISPPRDPYAPPRRSAATASGRDRTSALTYEYVDGYLQDDILTKVDRASMACSLEVRAPFLDLDLVEFLGRVPSNLKLRRTESKYLLKRAMRGTLPQEIVARPKKGFGVPIAEWLKNELRDAMLDMLSPARLARQGIFDAAGIERLIRAHLTGAVDNRKQLWTLFCFQLWYDAYATAGAGAGSVASR